MAEGQVARHVPTERRGAAAALGRSTCPVQIDLGRCGLVPCLALSGVLWVIGSREKQACRERWVARNR